LLRADTRWLNTTYLVAGLITQLSQTIARRVGQYLERQGLLEQDAENSYLTTDAVSEDLMNQLLGHSITYRIAVGPQAGRKVFTLQTLPACEPDDYTDTAGKASGFSLHAGVAARSDERKKLERQPNSKHRALVTPSKRSKKTHCRIDGDERSPVERHAAMTCTRGHKGATPETSINGAA